ncbi:hypothetical protein TNCV_3190611 [Trichonephila clavipes]|nr:hypothetical protein TNCV_3190611 [Trichonephila clavipes]
MDECTRHNNVVYAEGQDACRRANKSVCVVTMSRYTKSSRLSLRRKYERLTDALNFKLLLKKKLPLIILIILRFQN